MNLDQLHRLIQSLDRNEQLKFSTYINKKKTTKYAKLYEFLKSEEIDLGVKSLKDLHKKSYKELLDHLFKFKRGEDTKYLSKKLYNKLLDAKFLFDKDFFVLAYKKLKEVKTIAKDIYHYSYFLEANRLMLDISSQKKGAIHVIRDMPSIQILEEESMEMIERMKIYTYHKYKYAELHQLVKQGNCCLSELKKKFETYIQSNPPLGLSEQRYIQSQILYHHLLGNYQETIVASNKAIVWWELPKNEIYQQEESYRYCLTLLHHIQFILKIFAHSIDKAKLREEVEACFRKISAISRHHRDKKRIEDSKRKSELNYRLVIGDYTTAYQLMDLMERRRELEQKSTKDKKVFFSYFIQTCFWNVSFQEGIKYIKALIQEDKTFPAIRSDIFPTILPVIILIALSNKEHDYISKKQISQWIQQSKEVFTNNDSDYFDRFFDYLHGMNEIDCLVNNNSFHDFILSHQNNLYAAEAIHWVTNR